MSQQPISDVSKGDAIEFTVKNEPWSRYKLEDNTVLLGKFILLKFVRTGHDNAGQPIYAWSSQNLFTTYAPKSNKGTPSPGPLSPRVEDHTVTSIDFERVGSEQWNIYDLKDGTLIRIKLEPSRILKTDKYAGDGDPYYIVNSQTVQRIKSPPDLARKVPTKAVKENPIYK